MNAKVPVLRLEAVTKRFRVGSGGRRTDRLTAVDDVSLEVQAGQTLGLVGESGCGKSTLARMILMLDAPDSGTIEIAGTRLNGLSSKALQPLRSRVQMVFQDPFSSLNPRMNVGSIIAEPMTGPAGREITRGDRAAQVSALLELVGLRAGDAQRFPSELSGGQRQRVGIARALALKATLLVLDEPVSALDLSVQAQVINLLDDIQAQLGVAYIFISHDLSVVRHVADEVAVMYLGRIVEHGRAADVFDSPRHPYTAALLSAAPTLDALDGVRSSEILLSGELPSPIHPPSGCTFRTRCWRAEDSCADDRPLLAGRLTSPAHKAACHFPLQPAAATSTG